MESFVVTMMKYLLPCRTVRHLNDILPLFLIGCMFSVTAAWANPGVVTDSGQAFASLPELDSRFQEMLDGFLARGEIKSKVKVDSLSSLIGIIYSDKSLLERLAIVRANLPLIKSQIHQSEIFTLLDFLYQNNDTATIKKLSDQIKAEGSQSEKATNYFFLAKYYNTRANWKGVKASLASFDVKLLSLSDQHYYYLLMGYALQQLKEHRKAYSYYGQIPEGSPYYAYAKLDEGTAYLRQGWWTEAHMEFKKAIESLQSSQDRDFVDRLYTVLGYSQLHYEFYRDARTSLRHVNIDGPFTNKALMGLGLSAAYQKDFLGAINAFEILADKKPHDLNVDEVKLLLSKAYEEVDDLNTAAASYQNAVAYYSAKISKINQVLKDLQLSSVDALGQHIRDLDKSGLELYGKQEFIPDYFYNNYQAIVAMRNHPQVGNLRKSVEALQHRYQKQLRVMVEENIELRKAMVNSYLSQAKLGMAKLYDKN